MFPTSKMSVGASSSSAGSAPSGTALLDRPVGRGRGRARGVDVATARGFAAFLLPVFRDLAGTRFAATCFDTMR